MDDLSRRVPSNVTEGSLFLEKMSSGADLFFKRGSADSLPSHGEPSRAAGSQTQNVLECLLFPAEPLEAALCCVEDFQRGHALKPPQLLLFVPFISSSSS